MPPLRRQQVEALAALEAAWAQGRHAAWVVLPPGGGKTRLGLEAVRSLRRRAVVLGPNTAIQGQWTAQARDLGLDVGEDRELTSRLTVLTYQAVAVFTPDDEPDDAAPTPATPRVTARVGVPSPAHSPTPPVTREGEAEGEGSGYMGRLHPNAVALIGRLAAAGPLTLVLDECHHLLEVWGELLAEVLDRLPDARVVALTATPPASLSTKESALVTRLFGPIVYAATIPGFVRDGYLAPFRELVYFTEPTPSEATYLAGTAERFAQLRSDLMTPGLTSTPFLEWLDQRFVRRTSADGRDAISWAALEKGDPDLAAAALRAAHAGLLEVPAGASLREQHRAPMSADDWIVLLDDFLRGSLLPSDDPRDREVVEAVRAAVPGIGYRLTRHGLARGTAPADRVVARSASKAVATIAIADAELGARGENLRMLVLCDYERASAEVPEGLVGVITPEEGSARGVLRRLVADPLTAGLDPVLVSGSRVACAATLVPSLVAWLRAQEPTLDLDDPTAQDDDSIADLAGRWTSRTWVPLLTRWLEQGHGHVLVGTRALLGEGWDARRVDVMVDLTSATTPVAVTQTRGRALRTDPQDPLKVAHHWTVVCVADGHPLGDRDYQRLVRKHAGFYAVTGDGLITDGVAHIDPSLSPFAPPESTAREALDVAMLRAADDLDGTRALWRIGTPYDDTAVPEVRVTIGRSLGCDLLSVAGGRPLPRAVRGDLSIVPGAPTAVRLRPGWWRAMRLWLDAGEDPEAGGEQARVVMAVAAATGEALHAAGESPVGSEAVRIAPTTTGSYRVWLDGADEAVAARFATALDEVLSPLAAPRYVVPRVVVPVPADRAERRRLAWRQMWRRAVPATVVWHAVPALLAARKEQAAIFAAAWNRWVSPGQAVWTGSPEGAGILTAQRGDDPFDVQTAMRTEWR